MYYIITFFVLVGIYVLILNLMKYMKKVKAWNLLFAFFVYIPYVMLVLIVYSDVGINDWNFLNTLPVANVSPFMFSLVPVILLLPKNTKKYFLLLISLLSVGMFFSTAFNCFYYASIGYKFHFHFVLDYISHVFLSLWGVYLIKSKQINLDRKSSFISSLIIVLSALVMMFLNLIFDTAFFGLSLNGKHNIYNNVLVQNSIISEIIYLVY